MTNTEDETDDRTEQTDEEYSVDRRTFIKGAGAAAGAAAAPQGARAAQDVLTQDADALSNTLQNTAELSVLSPTSGILYAQAKVIEGAIALTDPDGSNNQDLWETIYADAVNTEDDLTSSIVELENNVQNTVGAALSEGKIEMLKAIKNGETEANAAQTAKSEINNFYSKLRKTAYAAQKRLVEQLKLYEAQRVANGIAVNAATNSEFLYSPYVSGTPENYVQLNSTIADRFSGSIGTNKGDVYHPVDPANVDGISSVGDVQGIAFRDRDTNLSNGDSVTVTDVIVLGDDGSSSPAPSVATHYDGGGYTFADDAYTGSTYRLSLNVRDFGDTSAVNTVDDARGAILDARRFRNVIQQIESARQTARSEMDALASNIYSNYSASDITQEQIDDLLSPYDRIRNQVSNYLDTGSNLYATSVAFENGLAATDTTYSVEVSYNSAKSEPYVGIGNPTGSPNDILEITRQSDGTTKSVSFTGLPAGETATIYLGTGTNDPDNNIYYAGFSNVPESDTVDIGIDENQDGTVESTVPRSYDYTDDLASGTYQGSVYAFDASVFADTLSVGDTFNGSQTRLQTVIQLIYTDSDGTVKRAPLLGQWEVTDLIDSDGNSVDTVDVWEPTFQSTDTTNLDQQIQDYLDRQDKTDEEGSTPSGGDPNGGGGQDIIPIILGALGLYGAYKYFVDDDGDDL